MPVFPVISARIRPESLQVVDHAADMKGWPRARIVEEGAIQYAQLIIAQEGARQAAARKAMRRAKARLGGLARHGKK